MSYLGVSILIGNNHSGALHTAYVCCSVSNRNASVFCVMLNCMVLVAFRHRKRLVHSCHCSGEGVDSLFIHIHFRATQTRILLLHHSLSNLGQCNLLLHHSHSVYERGMSTLDSLFKYLHR